MESKNAFAITPRNMFEKMLVEYESFKNDPKSTRHAINFALTAYHLREWVWHSYLENNPDFKKKILGNLTNESDFNLKINSECLEFEMIRELANNIKHFYSQDENGVIKETIESQPWNKISCRFAITWEQLRFFFLVPKLVIENRPQTHFMPDKPYLSFMPIKP